MSPNGTITRAAFWELVRFDYPTHQIALCTEKALTAIKYVESKQYRYEDPKRPSKRELKFRNDLFYVCSVIERTARKVRHRNKYVVNKLGPERINWLFRFADVLHNENQDEVCDRLISECRLRKDNFDITDVDPELCTDIPTVNDIAKVYERLIWMTSTNGEEMSHAVTRVYNNWICRLIDDYNGCAYYSSSLALEQAYRTGEYD